MEENKTEERRAATCALMKEWLEGGHAMRLEGTPCCVNPTVAFFALLEAAKSAEESIRISYYGICDGRAWQLLFPILEERAAAGVRVWLFGDAIGSHPAPPKRDLAALRRAGAVVRFPLLHKGFPARDHRKIAVVDRKFACIGGFNMADDYFDPGRVCDTAWILRGRDVAPVAWLFDEKWAIREGAAREKKRRFRRAGAIAPPLAVGALRTFETAEMAEDIGAFERAELALRGWPVAMLLGGKPKDGRGEELFLSMLSDARESVTVLTPYLFPPKRVIRALAAAVRRGVKVTFVLPDPRSARAGTSINRLRFRALRRIGVSLRVYREAFLHAKVWLIDGRTAFCGSYNLDVASLRVNYEDGLLLLSPVSVGSVAAKVRDVLLDSRPLGR